MLLLLLASSCVENIFNLPLWNLQKSMIRFSEKSWKTDDNAKLWFTSSLQENDVYCSTETLCFVFTLWLSLNTFVLLLPLLEILWQISAIWQKLLQHPSDQPADSGAGPSWLQCHDHWAEAAAGSHRLSCYCVWWQVGSTCLCFYDYDWSVQKFLLEACVVMWKWIYYLWFINDKYTRVKSFKYPPITWLLCNGLVICLLISVSWDQLQSLPQPSTGKALKIMDGWITCIKVYIQTKRSRSF